MYTNKPEIRIQHSFLHRLEKKVLIWLAERVPRYINSDHLTIIGFIGAIISCLGYILTNLDFIYLWMASFGLVVNWVGDSLDGTLARVRNAQRPIYGFFFDHNIDALTILVVCIGVGLSPLVSFSIAMLILAGYLLLSIFSYINTYLKGEFRITYMNLGPTEFRIIAIITNTALIYLPIKNMTLDLIGFSIGIIDAVCIVIAIILILIYLYSFIANIRMYGRIDPPHHYYTKNSSS